MDAAETLLLEQIPRLRRYARALTGQAGSADDLVQDCLERAWSRLHRWRAGSDMRAWLFTIMHRVNANRVRRLRGRPAEDPLDEEGAGAASPQAPEMALEIRDLDRALQRLPEPQRQVLLLVALEGFSYEAVAATLDLPLGTVMSRLHRARERLRAELGGGSAPRLRRVK
ncbi:MAG TPA: RNA polymerase sigma factor [Gammaproteobacteria bacterium]